MDSATFTKDIFLNDIKNHKIKIIKNDGVYRHIKYSNGTFNCAFEIITWPEHLAITGDMGDFVFSRTHDMFDFFRRDALEINSYYWAEKVRSESVFGNGIREFSVKEFRDRVIEEIKSYLNLEENEEIPEDMLEEIQSLMWAEDEYECVTAMRDFSSDKISFEDFWEHSCMVKTYHYIWCCYAIVWAISEYDKVYSKAE